MNVKLPRKLKKDFQYRQWPVRWTRSRLRRYHWWVRFCFRVTREADR